MPMLVSRHAIYLLHAKHLTLWSVALLHERLKKELQHVTELHELRRKKASALVAHEALRSSQ
jgi:hypothetical protein